jgi:hypothetical protein
MIISLSIFNAASREVNWLETHQYHDPIGRAARMFGISPRSLQNYLDRPCLVTALHENFRCW